MAEELEANWSGQGDPIPIIMVSALLILPIAIISSYKLTSFHLTPSDPQQMMTAKPSKFMIVNQAIFYLSCIVFAIVYPFCDILPYLSTRWRIMFGLETLTHGVLHFYALINIFYARLLSIFNDTEFALSSRSRRIFSVCYVILIVLGLLSWAVIQLERENPNSLLMLCISGPYLLVMIAVTQSLSFMFVRKLYRLNRPIQATQRDLNQLSPLIRKCTVLSVVAMSGTLLYILCIGVATNLRVLPQWMVNMMKQIDLCTNLLCVSLSYSFAKTYYARCCYVCDAGSRRCCSPSAEQNLTADLRLDSRVTADSAVRSREVQVEVSNGRSECGSSASPTNAASVAIDEQP